MELKENRAAEERKSQQSLRKDHRRGEEGGREGRRESGRESVNGRGRHSGGGMREKVCRRKQIEKVRNLIWLRVSAASLSPSLSLQMEVNVKQSLLLVSGGINSLEWD